MMGVGMGSASVLGLEHVAIGPWVYPVLVTLAGWLVSSGPGSHGLFLALITVPRSLCGVIFLRPCCASPLGGWRSLLW